MQKSCEISAAKSSHSITLISLINVEVRINVEVGINVEGGILWKKIMHNSNKRGVEGGNNLRNQ